MDVFVTREHWATSGTRLSALTAGQTGQPMMLLLHGIPASAELWREVLPLVALQGWYAVAPDLPGYGHTRTITDAYSLQGTANLLTQWLQMVKPQTVWVVGHDLGGLVAQYLMINCKSLLDGVSLVNSPAGNSWPVPAVKGMIQAATKGLFAPLAAIGMMKRKRIYNGMKRVFTSKDLTEAEFNRVFFDGKFHRFQCALRFQRMLKELHPTDTTSLLQQLPTDLRIQIIWGMADQFQPWDGPGQMLRQQMPQANVEQLAGVGHYVPMEQPALLAAHLGSRHLLQTPLK